MRHELIGKNLLKICFILICQQQAMLHKQHWLNFINLLLTFNKQGLCILAQSIKKVNNADYYLIQQTNMLFQLINILPRIHNTVYLQKELLKRFGQCVLMFYKMAFLFQKMKFGIKDLNKRTKVLEKMVKEF